MKKQKETKKYYAIYYSYNSDVDIDRKTVVLNTDFRLCPVIPNEEIEVFIGSKEQHQKIFERLKNVYKWENYQMELREVEK